MGDMKCDLVKSFNTVLSQMLAGMIRIMPDRRVQFDMWKEAVTEMNKSDMYIMSMVTFLQADQRHVSWALESNTALFDNAAANKDVVNGEVAQMFGELSHRFADYSPKTKQNLWSFVSLLTAYAIQYCELIATPATAVQDGLERAMKAMPEWQDKFVQHHGRQPTLAEVQEFSAQILGCAP